MSLWEFAAAMDGFAEFHGSKKNTAPDLTDAELAAQGIEGF
jgi:hypothetical protein